MKKNFTQLTLVLFLSSLIFSGKLQAQSCPWAKKASGTNEDFGVAVATDQSGNVYYLGNFYSQTLVFGSTTLHNQPYQAFNYGTEMFLVKYDSCGTLKWAKQAGGNSDVFGRALATDATGNIYVTGYFFADTAYFGTLKLANTSGLDAFVVKYDANGTPQWAKLGSGNTHDKPYSIAVDGGNNIYITGSFNSSTITFGANSLANGTDDGSTYDVFIAKFDNLGTSQWIRGSTSNANTTDDAFGYGISTDGAGNVYVGGAFASNYIRFANDSLPSHGNYDRDIYVVKYDANGNEQWLRAAGGTSNDAGYSIASDISGNIYLTGYIGDQATASFGPYTISNSGAGRQIFLAKYNSSGTPQWARTAAGDYYSDNISNYVTVDGAGNPYIIGSYTSDSLNIGPITLFNASLLNGSGGGDYFCDVFVAKYKPSGSLSWARSAGGDSTDLGNGIAAGPNGALYITGEYFSPTINFNGISLTGVNSTGDAFIANNIQTTALVPDICLVSSDSLSQNNVISWDKTSFTSVGAFAVYRETSTGTYKRIGLVPFDSLSQYIDTVRMIGPANGDPNIGTYRYKLQTIDTSGCASLMSPYHNTVYFLSSGNGNFTFNTYNIEGQPATPVTQVDLLRDDLSNGNWNVIGSVAGTSNIINDPQYSTYQSTASWRVSDQGFDCTPTRGAINTSRSNIKTNSTNSIASFAQNVNMNVYPNPFSNSLTMEISAEGSPNYTLEITNTLGQVLQTQKVNASKVVLSTEGWASGVYFYRLYTAQGAAKAGKISKE